VTRSVDECEVLVVGGGPAGATAAQLLASWGRSVVVLHRPTIAHLTLAESLPASTRKLLAFLGQLERVEAARFFPNTGNRADWAGETRVTTSADAGFHVPREVFDRVLREGATSAGARIVHAAVKQVDAGDLARAAATTSDGAAIEWRARMVLDCSGRAGVVARRGLRRVSTAYRTLAIVAEWDCPDWPADERTCTTIESFADGWVWSVPLSATRRQCTVMIEPPDKKGTGIRSLSSIYESELAKGGKLAARLTRAQRASDPWTCDASIYDAVRAADGNTLLVGDAASFIEPLSSAGVKKSLLSAWRAAVVANTCLANPAMTEPALDLFVDREREVYADCDHRTSAFFAEAAAAYGTPFWSVRAGRRTAADSRAGSMEFDDASDASIGRDASVRDAFERLRATDHVRLRPAAAMRFAPVPAIEGREVVMREAVVVPGLDSPLQYAAGIDLAQLTRIASRCGDVPAIIESYQQHAGPVELAGLLTGLSLLVARRALVAEDAGS
jgi:flavin-dependent dehydrogenase